MHKLVRCAARAAIVSLALGSACARTASGGADVIVTHAKIWAGANEDAPADAEALAIIGDRVVDVGRASAIDRWRGPSTVIVDAEGRRVVPGFNDAHVHLVDGGMRLDEIDLHDAQTPVEFTRRIAERTKARPGEWITGGHWNASRWPDGARPGRALIDDATNGTPVFVTSADGREALANAAALGRAGITETTPDPRGGTIVRDARALPTGLLEGAAIELVSRVVPPPAAERRVAAAQRALEHARSFGVTSIQDLGATYADVDIYADLDARGDLSARIYAVLPEAGWYDQAKIGLRRAFGSPSLRLGAIRVIDPGGGPSPSASPGPTPSASPIRTRLLAADHAGLQICLDTDDGLTLASAIVATNGERDRRLRLESTSDVAVAALDRIAALNVVASVRIGDDRHAPSERAIRTLLNRHVRVALGSDWPSGSLNPFTSLAAAVASGATVQEALAAYTRGSAFAEFQESQKGTLVRGALADLVVLTDDVLAVPVDRIKDVRVLTTIVGGKVVYHRRP